MPFESHCLFFQQSRSWRWAQQDQQVPNGVFYFSVATEEKLTRAAPIQALKEKAIRPIDVPVDCSDEIFVPFRHLGLFSRSICGVARRVSREFFLKTGRKLRKSIL